METEDDKDVGGIHRNVGWTLRNNQDCETYYIIGPDKRKNDKLGSVDGRNRGKSTRKIPDLKYVVDGSH